MESLPGIIITVWDETSGTLENWVAFLNTQLVGNIFDTRTQPDSIPNRLQRVLILKHILQSTGKELGQLANFLNLFKPSLYSYPTAWK